MSFPTWLRHLKSLVEGARKGRNRQRPRRKQTVSRRHLSPEVLESRDCPSTLYDFDLIGRVGQAGLTEIAPNTSINDAGKVAFIGKLSDGQGLFVGTGVGAPRNINPTFSDSPNRTFGPAVQINNRDQVVAVDRDAVGLPVWWQLRTWDANGTDARTPVATASSPRQSLTVGDNLSGHVSINNEGKVVYAALETTPNSAFWHLAVPGLTYGNSKVAATLPIPNSFRPMAASNDRFVVRLGNKPTDPIILYSELPGRFFPVTVASVSRGFSALGSSPGISDDGCLVAFYGDLTPAGAATLGLWPGPGIFVSLPASGGGRVIQRIAGVSGNGYLDPGENYADTNGNGQWDSGEPDFGPFKSFAPATRVNINDNTVAFLATSESGNAKGLYTSSFSYSDADVRRSFTAGDPELVAEAGRQIVVDGQNYTLTDLNIHDALNARGELAFWADTDRGKTVLKAKPVRAPVLVVPGIAGTMPLTEHYRHWLMNRGVHPNMLQIDPLGGFYHNIIQTLRNAGYVRDQDLFVANYDWRMMPGPVDPVNLDGDAANDRFDGRITGLTAAEITDETFAYGVDYLGWWLKRAAETWRQRHPDVPLTHVDVIAHSTGGLIARSYIQSDAYGASFGPANLPKIGKFVMVGVPNRGASKPWNPLQDNFIDDWTFRFVLSKVIKTAYEKLGQPGAQITSPDPRDAIIGQPDPVTFISRYIPTIRSLLATYNFLIPEGGTTPGNVNHLPTERNNLLLDLNAGLDYRPSGDPNAFADAVRQVIDIYGVNLETPTTAVTRRGSTGSRTIYRFNSIARADEPRSSEVWWEDRRQLENGDGTVPLESSIGQFRNDRRVRRHGFAQGGTTPGDVSHTGILSNVEVQRLILEVLGSPLPESRISTTLTRPGLPEVGKVFSEKIVSTILDPVEGFVVDAQGRRLGYSAATGALTEIPGSVYLGGADGIGWIFGPATAPLTFRLTGLGGNHYAQVSGLVGTTEFGVESSGPLAPGQQRTLNVVNAINYPPTAADDEAEADRGVTVTIPVLVNDRDPDGDPLRVTAVTTAGLRGSASVNPDGTVRYTAPANFDGVETFTYTVSDGRGGTATGTVRVAVPGRPRVVAVAPSGGVALSSLSEITIDFSHAMDPAQARNPANYTVMLNDQTALPIGTVAYADQGDRHRATLTLAPNAVLGPGQVSVRLNGRQLRSASGAPMSGTRDDLAVYLGADSARAVVGRTDDGSFGVAGVPSSFGHDLPRNVVTGDFNRDGFTDLITASAADKQILFHFGRGDARFAAPVALTLSGGAVPNHVFAVDWNTDGNLDLVVASFSPTNRYFVLLNDGTGQFRDAPDTPIPLGSDFPTPFADNLTGPKLAVFGDFTGDGLMDIAFDASRYVVSETGKIRIIGKDPFVGYSVVTELSLPSDMRSIFIGSLVTGDFNGDGKLDLVSGNSGAGFDRPQPTVFLSTPTGFAPPRVLQFTNTGNATGIRAGDYTGDGKLDLVIVHDLYSNFLGFDEGGVITILEGDGRGGFTEKPFQLLNRRSARMGEVGDVNNDGKLDLVLLASKCTPAGPGCGRDATEHQSVWVWLGNGRGNFTRRTQEPVAVLYPQEEGYSDFAGVALTDLDGDGFSDLALGSSRFGFMRVMRNDRTGVLNPGPDLVVTGMRSMASGGSLQDLVARYIVSADFNRDGIPDVAMQVGDSVHGLLTFLGTPDGRLELRSVLPNPVGSPGNSTAWIQAGDLNNDGNPDLIMAGSAAANRVFVLLGTGTGEFQPAPGSPYSLHGFAALNTFDKGTLVDVNRDGNLDLVTVALNDVSESLAYVVFFGDGRGALSFNPNTAVSLPPGARQPSPFRILNLSPAVTDLDRDGIPDLVIPAGLKVHFYRGNGNGTFTAGPVSDPGSPPGLFGYEPDGFLTGDYNGDGKQDLLGYSPTKMTLYLGDGAGRFTLDVPLTQQLSSRLFAPLPEVGGSTDAGWLTGLTSGDFNGDGLRDLAVSYRGAGVPYPLLPIVGVMLGDGTGRWQPALGVRLSGAASAVHVLPRDGQVVAGNFVLTPALAPVVVTSQSQAADGRLTLNGSGPAGATVTLRRGSETLRQVTAGADGAWTITLASPLPAGTHVLTLIARNATGGFSDETTLTVTVRADGVALLPLPPGQLRFSAANYNVSESGGTATITVTRTGGSAGLLTVQYATSNGTATAGQDYTATSETLTFASGETSKTFTIRILNDAQVEGDETVLLTLNDAEGGSTLGSPPVATLTIGDDDAPPAGVLHFGSGTYSVNESGGTATITVTRTGGGVGAVSVTYATTNGTATAGADYTSATGTLTWANGEMGSKTFTVPILDDTFFEGNETVRLTLSNAMGGAVLAPSLSMAVLMIVDDDPVPTFRFSAADYSVNENGGSITITVTRTGASPVNQTVQYATNNGTAMAGADYTAASGTLTFSPSETSRTFTVTVLNDSTFEGNETAFLTLSNPTGGATLGSPSAATLTIVDDDPPPGGWLQFGSATYSVNEGGGTATITVTRIGSTTGSVSVSYMAANGTATAGIDYSAATGSLTWANGEAGSKTFTVSILDDGAYETDETVNLSLSNPTGGAVLGSPATAVLTIVDNDPAPVFQFSAATYSFNENAGTVTITATRTGASAVNQTVQYATSNGTAAAGTDYTAASGTLTFGAGETSRTFTVVLLDDSVYEVNETLNLTLSNPTGGAVLGSPATAVLTIVDNDPIPSFAFSTASYSLNESAGTVTITVTRIGASAVSHTVQYATADGTAIARTDYGAASGALTFGPGETSRTFTVTLLDDNVYEAGETLHLVLSNPSAAATLGSPSAAVLTIVDDDPVPQFRFSAAGYTAHENGGSVVIAVERLGASAITQAVQYATGNGTAVAGGDFTAASGRLTFGPGETSKTFVVPVVNDQFVKLDRWFVVGLSDPDGGAVLGTPTLVGVAIQDDDLPVVPNGPPPGNLPVVAIGFAKSREQYTNLVIGAYQRYLKRLPEAAGLENWVGNMLAGRVTEERLEAGFIGSPEYITGNGGRGRGWIIGMYRDLLGRDPAEAEVQGWLQALARGVTEAEVAFGFAASRERQAQRVQRNYQIYLGRTATPSEVNGWVEAFLRGVTNQDIIAGFVGSPEYYASSQKGRSNRAVWLVRAYEEVLFRWPTRGEVEGWLYTAHG